jgi:glutathione S-transferase
LELEDGTVLAEITAICEYVDEKKKDTPSLIGDTPEERARTRMWARRIDLNIAEPAANGFRFAEGLKMFENRVRCIPGSADGLKATARDKLKWLDGLMGSKPFIAGDKLTMADILLFAFLDFMANVGQPLDPDCKNLTAWFGRMKARPSAAA